MSSDLSLTTRNRRTSARSFGRDLLIVVFGLVGYLLTRTVRGDDRAIALVHADELLAFERRLGLDIERGLQDQVLGQGDWVAMFNAVYTWTYWPALVLSLAILWFVRRADFYVLRNALFVSALLGLTIMLAYPVAPPRMLPGFTDTLTARTREHFVARPSGLINQYAALPSFHVGWFALALGTVAQAFRRWSLVVLSLAATATMSAAVIVTANHFVVDIILGVALSYSGYLIARRWTRTRHATQQQRSV